MGIDKDAALKKIQDSEKLEFEVFEGEEHKTFLENYKDTVIAPSIKKTYDDYDRDVEEASGEKRNHDEKSYDYVKRVIKLLNGRAKKAVTLETTIVDLEEKIKSGSGDESLKTDLEKAKTELASVQKIHVSEKETWEKEKSELVGSHKRSGMSNILDRALMGIKFKDGISDQVRSIVVDSVKNELLEIAEMVDSKMVFTDKEGDFLRDKGSLNPYTPEEMLRSKLKDILDEGRKMPGTGVKPAIKEDKDGKKSVNYVPSDWVKTKDDLTKDLAEKGFVRDTPEYLLALDKYFDPLPY